MGLFPMNMNVGSEGATKSLTSTLIYGIAFTSYTDGANVTMAYSAGSAIPIVSNDIVNLSTKKALINCTRFHLTDNGQAQQSVNYNAGDTVEILTSGTHVYTFVPR